MGLYFRHHSSLLHDPGPHPENAGRIRAIEATLQEAGWPGLDRLEPPSAEREWLLRVHDPALIDSIEDLCATGGGAIDPETIVTPQSWEAALRAAGAAADGARRLLAGEATFAFCGMRPPGHHAESDRSMGFCLFNNAAIGAAHAIADCGAERILILDWDVHHGNGTAEIFDARADVLYVSIHQSPLYPGTGAAGDSGSGPGRGATLNLPVPPGAGGAEFVGLVEHVVGPVARAYDPDLIIFSSGYDAHIDDPLADCRVSTADFGTMSAHVRELGRELGAPILVCLEGGYDPGALAGSTLATVLALQAGEPPKATAPVALVAEAAARVAGLDRWHSAF